MSESQGFLSIERIRLLEHQALAAARPGELMRRAAIAVTELADQLLQNQNRNTCVTGLIGPGNNGADALLALMMLARRGYQVRACAIQSQEFDQANPESNSDRAAVLSRWQAQGGILTPLSQLPDWLPALSGAQILPQTDILLLDGLFGIGIKRPITGQAAQIAQLTHRLDAPVIAIDAPSGLNADSGAIIGGERAAVVKASHTVTMLANKAGLHTGIGKAVSGRVSVAPLGVTYSKPEGRLIDRDWVTTRIKSRGPDTHKGSFGTVGVLGGAASMPGAALLAASGALAMGAGKVAIMSPAGELFDTGKPQLMSWSVQKPADLDRHLKSATTLVVGCGLGSNDAAHTLVSKALACDLPMVLDADGLNIVAASQHNTTLSAALVERNRPGVTVITPHPLEAARILGQTVNQIQNNRIDAALDLARRTQSTVILKGAGSVIAAPDGRWAINASGGPSLATGGTGDILAGMVGALLAQGYLPWEAAAIAAWVHGNAGDRWSDKHRRGVGLSAADLLHQIVLSFNSC